MLDTVDNKSETVEQSVKFYLLNKDKPKIEKEEPLLVENVGVEL